MCGIIGYVGTKDALPILIDSLKKLEYRGYDSSGVALLDSHAHLLVRKSKGKIRQLEDLIVQKPLAFASVGICHTRWATHGLPSDINAHPHCDAHHSLAVVHNGIIENYQALKDALKKKGVHFSSQTDTEVIAHLIASFYKGNLVQAVQKALKLLRGAFAIGVIHKNHPDTLIAARQGSPLIVGLGDHENLIASDPSAILDYTRRVIYLEEGQMAVLHKDHVQVMSFTGKVVKPKVNTITYSVEVVQKQGYAHFMLKEIHQQPSVIKQMLNLRLKNGRLNLEGLGLSDEQLKKFKRVAVVACGTAYHAGLVGKYLLEEMANVPVDVDTSSEFRYRKHMIDKNTLVIAVSQSGETADTLAAAREAKVKGATIVAICNVIGSSLAREADHVLFTHAGPEIGVASTKAYSAQLMMFYFLSLKMAMVHKAMPNAQIKVFMKQLSRLPGLCEEILKSTSHIRKVAEANSHFGCFLFLGRHVNFPSALEGALKLKEISYIPAEGYAAGEMKHGPIALIDEYRAVVCINPQSHVYEKMFSNIQEIRARKGNIIAIVTKGDHEIKHQVHHTLEIPSTHELLTPLMTVLPLQLLAYYIAVKRGCDVDQPRNLAKSVTVE